MEWGWGVIVGAIIGSVFTWIYVQVIKGAEDDSE